MGPDAVLPHADNEKPACPNPLHARESPGATRELVRYGPETGLLRRRIRDLRGISREPTSIRHLAAQDRRALPCTNEPR
jgi:hypothetical protein